MCDRVYKLSEVSKILNVSKSTLRAWDREGFFVAGRTRGRHRVYNNKQIEEIKLKFFKRKN